MSSKQVTEILDHIGSFHQRLSGLYRELAERQVDDRRELLLEHLADREQEFSRCLKAYEDDMSHEVLNTWIQFHADEQFDLESELSRLTTDMTTDRILEVAFSCDEKLIELYRHLQSETAVPRLQELFSNLVAMEEAKSRHYARTIQEL